MALDDFAHRLQLLKKDDEEIARLYLRQFLFERFAFVEDDLAMAVGRGFVDGAAQQPGDFAVPPAPQVFVLFDEQTVKASGGDVARFDDNAVVTVAGHADDPGHAPRLKL